MAHTKKHAQKLLRDMPKDPEELLARPNCWDPQFLEVYFEHCDEMLFHDPRAGLKLADIAPRLALATLEPDPGGDAAPETEKPPADAKQRRWFRELQVRAYVVRASALRATGQLAEAEAAYGTASRLAETGVRPVEEARLKIRLAVLRIDQRKLDEAHKLCQEAIEIYKSAEDKRRLATAYTIFGMAQCTAGDFCDAIDSFGEVLANPAADARSTDAAVINLAYAFTHSTDPGAVASALRWIAKARRAIRNQRRTLLRHKLTLIDGKLHLKLGFDRHAERLFRRARNGFMTLGAPFELAMASLDLSTVLHREKRWAEFEEMATETYKRFRELSADTEAIAALSLWMDGARTRKLKAKVIAEVAEKVLKRSSCPAFCGDPS